MCLGGQCVRSLTLCPAVCKCGGVVQLGLGCAQCPSLLGTDVNREAQRHIGTLGWNLTRWFYRRGPYSREVLLGPTT